MAVTPLPSRHVHAGRLGIHRFLHDTSAFSTLPSARQRQQASRLGSETNSKEWSSTHARTFRPTSFCIANKPFAATNSQQQRRPPLKAQVMSSNPLQQPLQLQKESSPCPTLFLCVSSCDGRPGLCLVVGASLHGCRLFRFAIRIHTPLALEPPSPSLSRTIPFFSHAVVSLHPNFYEPSLLHCRSSFPLPTFFLTCYIHFLACFVLLPCSFCRTVL